MEFKSLKNIETSFRQIRLFGVVFVAMCAVVVSVALVMVFNFAEHVRRFHELFFSLSPDKSAIEHNINRALILSDKSAYNYYADLSEKGYYNRIISGNINQVVQVDSVVCDFNNYPYTAMTYARQMIIRESNVTNRTLVTTCKLSNVSRSDDNPNGFMIEGFTILENKDINTIKRN